METTPSPCTEEEMPTVAYHFKIGNKVRFTGLEGSPELNDVVGLVEHVDELAQVMDSSSIGHSKQSSLVDTIPLIDRSIDRIH